MKGNVMSTSTIDHPQTVNLTDICGTEQELLFIEGQPLEEYFAQAEGLIAPVNGEVALIDGLPAKLDQPLEPGTSVSVGVLARNG